MKIKYDKEIENKLNNNEVELIKTISKNKRKNNINYNRILAIFTGIMMFATFFIFFSPEQYNKLLLFNLYFILFVLFSQADKNNK